MRPYRYAPALKSEIEKQVTEMLDAGIIQPSQSEFSSSVILVKKMDNTYRFCVDYRHLNALTVKTIFPVPVIDEFLDEFGRLSYAGLEEPFEFGETQLVNPELKTKQPHATHQGTHQ